MIRMQKFLVVDVNMSEDEAMLQVRSNECVGYFRGIPMTLRGQATAESWSLPHVWTETWDDGLADQP